jgi:hypothetical protein
MPIPVYRNLAKYVDNITSKTFYEMSRADKLTPVIAGDKILWFANEGKYKHKSKLGTYKKNALVFIGKKSITVKPKFDYLNMMKGEMPRMITRAKREIDGTVRRLSRGIIKSGDFDKSE